jgi:hypothetical protein
MPSLILNQFGKPAQYAGVSNALYTSPPMKKSDPRRDRMDRDYSRMLTQSGHSQMLSDARSIAEWPIVGGMVRQKADYVCASKFTPYFVGGDESFGSIAEEKLSEVLKIVNARRGPFTWEKDWHIGCQALDVDADYFILLTETATGFPQYQVFEAHRVGSRSGNIVKGGRWDGSLCINGIIYGDAGDEVAYNVLGATAADDAQVPASDMIRVSDPMRASEGRGVSPVAWGVKDWYDVRGTRENEKVAQDIHSKLTIVESNEAGKRDSMAARLAGDEAATTSSGLEIDEYEAGHVRYVKSGKGSIEAWSSNRPSAGSRQFEQDIIAGASFGMGWRIEMMDLSKLGGAGVRGFQDNINTAIQQRFSILKPFALRVLQYIVAKLIKRGDLPESVDWWRWDFCKPAEFTVDAGRSIQGDIDAIRAGLELEEDVVGERKGVNYERFLRRKIKGIKLRKRLAQEAGVPEWEVGFVTRPGDVQQQAPQQAAEPDADEAGDQQDPKDKQDTSK